MSQGGSVCVGVGGVNKFLWMTEAEVVVPFNEARKQFIWLDWL